MPVEEDTPAPQSAGAAPAASPAKFPGFPVAGLAEIERTQKQMAALLESMRPALERTTAMFAADFGKAIDLHRAFGPFLAALAQSPALTLPDLSLRAPTPPWVGMPLRDREIDDLRREVRALRHEVSELRPWVAQTHLMAGRIVNAVDPPPNPDEA